MQPHRIDTALATVLFLACVVFNLLFSPIGQAVDEHRVWSLSLLMGSIAVQPMLIALLASLSSSFVTRLPCAVSACVILGHAACVTSWRVLAPANATDDSIAYGLETVTASLLGFAAASLVFQRIRRGWLLGIDSHLTRRPFGASDGSAARGRSIHAWTTPVAVILAAACIAHLAREWSAAGANGRLVALVFTDNVVVMAFQVGILLLMGCLLYAIVMPIVLTALAFPKGIAILMPISLALSAALGVFCTKLFLRGSETGAISIVGVVFGATAAGLLAALALRCCGYQVRLGEPPAG